MPLLANPASDRLRVGPSQKRLLIGTARGPRWKSLGLQSSWGHDEADRERVIARDTRRGDMKKTLGGTARSTRRTVVTTVLLSIGSIGAAALVIYPAAFVFIGMAMKESGSQVDVPIWLAGGLAMGLIGAAASLPWVVARRSARPCIVITGVFFALGVVFGLAFARL
jgi:hypothetical protein